MGTPDLLLAAQLHQRKVTVIVIENALVLAVTRRLIRPPGSPTLGAIRSLAYFLPIIEEVRSLRVHQDYFRYLRHKLEHIGQAHYAAADPTGPHAPAADHEKAHRTPTAWMISLALSPCAPSISCRSQSSSHHGSR